MGGMSKRERGNAELFSVPKRYYFLGILLTFGHVVCVILYFFGWLMSCFFFLFNYFIGE